MVQLPASMLNETIRLIGSRVPIGQILPGEREGTLDPRDYGFGVIKDGSLTPEEERRRIGDFYAQARLRSGVTIPQLEKYLRVDTHPAEALIARHNALKYPYHCTFDDVKLIIDEGVFCPTLTNASRLLLATIDFKPSERVLDVFSGSGAFGIIAAMKGSEAVTIDISERAVACTVKNADSNNVADRVNARLGTMQNCLAPEEKFDLIIANPPLLSGDQSDELYAAIFDPGLQATRDFVTSLPKHLAENGRCYLITSSAMLRYGYDIERLVTQSGLKSSRIEDANYAYESYRVHKITRSMQEDN